MWDHESQRIGKQKCTPLEFKLHGIADMLGFIGLIIFIGLILYSIICLFSELTFPTYWLFIIPFIFAIIANLLFNCSWQLAYKKDFKYDPEKCISSWNENGQKVTYSYGNEIQ